MKQAATSEAAAACLEGYALLALAALKFMMADATSRRRDSWPQWAFKLPALFDLTGVLVAWIRRAPSVIPKVAALGGATTLATAMHKAATAELKPDPAEERRPGWVQDACVALFRLIKADTAAAAPLVQPGSPAQWSRVEPALRNALPQQHCKEAAHAVASVAAALLRTPAALEAARRQEAEAQQRVAAAAAADAAMQQLLQASKHTASIVSWATCFTVSTSCFVCKEQFPKRQKAVDTLNSHDVKWHLNVMTGGVGHLGLGGTFKGGPEASPQESRRQGRRSHSSRCCCCSACCGTGVTPQHSGVGQHCGGGSGGHCGRPSGHTRCEAATCGSASARRRQRCSTWCGRGNTAGCAAGRCSARQRRCPGGSRACRARWDTAGKVATVPSQQGTEP